MTIKHPIGSVRMIYFESFYNNRYGSKNPHQFKGMWDCALKTIKKEGLPGVYRGGSLSICSSFLFRSIQLGTFTTLMDNYNPYAQNSGTLGFSSTFLCSYIARCAAIPLYYPVETVRRRVMMTKKENLPEGEGRVRYWARMTFMERSMFKGMASDFTRISSFGGVLVLVLYDRLKFYYST
mmetsp:Transcript_30082/g.46614  ORF Transcript_30082/g.46614 Transcript_30082/m.46614 type:complete len:180 (+) Transcript_30082:2096-2635(+)